MRNAQNAVKVLVKFLLLEKQRIPLAELPKLLSSMRLFGATNRRHLRQDHAELTQWVVAQLVKSSVAEVVEGVLVNRD